MRGTLNSTTRRGGRPRPATFGAALALATTAAVTAVSAALAQVPPQPQQQSPRPAPSQQAPARPSPTQPVPRQQPLPPPQGQQPGANLDRLIAGIGPLCLKAPARQCVDQGFAYADRNRDQRLSLPEARAVNDEVNAWSRANAPKLPPVERERLVMGLLVVQTVGPDALFQGYDTNGDGGLTKEELLADLRLDQRPLPQILSDPNAVDWSKMTGRAGMAAPLLKRLLPPL